MVQTPTHKLLGEAAEEDSKEGDSSDAIAHARMRLMLDAIVVVIEMAVMVSKMVQMSATRAHLM